MARDGSFKTREVCTAAGTTSTAVVRADGFRGQQFGEDLICLNYASGRCPYQGCANAHLMEEELPAGWTSGVVRKLEPGVNRILTEGRGRERQSDGPPNKRQRGGPRGGGGQQQNGGGWPVPPGRPPAGPRWSPPQENRSGPAGGRGW